MKKIILGVVIVAAIAIVVLAWPQSAGPQPVGGAISNTQTQTLKATRNYGIPQAVSPQPAANVVSTR